MKRLFLLFASLAFSSSVFAFDYVVRSGNDTLIISDVCLYATDGIAKITDITSEDAGLKITLTRDDSAANLIYDVAGEIEAITTLRTWVAPTANNVRFDDDADNGCYELQFAADSIDTGTMAVLTIEDTTAPTFMDREIHIQILAGGFYDLTDGTIPLLDARDTGLKIATTVASVTDNETFVGTAGAGSDDSYNGDLIAVLDKSAGTGECSGTIDNFITASTTFEVTWNGGSCGFTIAATDIIRVFVSGAGTAPTAVAIADQVWRETLADHSGVAGSTAESLDQIEVTTDGIILDTGTDGVQLIPPLATALSVLTGTCDAGTTTSCTDSVFSQASAEYWPHNSIVFIDDVVQAQSRCIDTFNPGTDTLSWIRPLTTAAGALSAYTIRPDPTCDADLVWDEVVETGPPTITARCMMQIVGAYTGGEWTQAGAVITYQDSGGNGAVITGTIQSPGFDTITITCP
jgi:hypothetical protein